MNTCESYVALLDGYIDGVLSPEEVELVENHLKTCPDCAQYVEDILAIEADFPTVDDVMLPENFTQSVMAEVAKHPRKTRKPSLAQRFALPAVACLAVLVYVGHDFGATQSTETAVTTSAASTMMADAPMERAVAEIDVSAEVAEPEPFTMPASASYYVPQSQTGDFFQDFTPLESDDGTIEYPLTPEEFAAFMAYLDVDNAYPDQETYWVIVIPE